MYRELHGLQETSHRTLLSRMDMQRWNQQPNHLHHPPSLPRATWNPNLEQRLSSQNCLLEVPLSRSQPSIKTSSSTAMLSTKNNERGRSRNRPCNPRSEPNLPVPSKMTRRESTQHSDPSLQQSKVTIQRQPWQQDEEREREGDAVPNLLSRMSRNPPDKEPVTKKSKVDESVFAWAGPETETNTKLSENLDKTLKLLGVYTVDLKTTMRSLTNSPSCPEFPDSEWRNIIGGKAVNLDAILSGQLSSTNDELKVEKFGDLELTFGAVEPTKIVKNGGEWS